MKRLQWFALGLFLVLSSGCPEQPVTEESEGKTTSEGSGVTAAPEMKQAAEVDVIAEDNPGDDEVGEDLDELMGMVTTESVTEDTRLREILEKWSRRPVSKSEKKELKKNRKAWKSDLMKAMLHKEPNVRSNVAAALAHLGKDKQVTALFLERMKAEEDGDVRGHIAKQFVTMKDKSAQGALIEMMRNDKNPSARANAAWALSKHGDKALAQPFLEALQDPESWVRLYAVNGVKRLRVKKAIPVLRVLLSDKSDLVAKKAREALKSLGAR